ncbi:integrase [Mesorhizobium sp. M0387]|uniref:integrase n=1 Tax=Mesorhizobium sp. M0387 TaxID=2956940 RepID=UPI00333D3E44
MGISLYRQFRKTLKGTPLTGRYMPYNWSNLPNPIGVQWMAYSWMLDEFGRELANTINRFTNDVHSLTAWSRVIQSLTQKKQFDATHEFIDTLATNALNSPYVVKGRFGFAAVHLCHQANMLKRPATWSDDLPLDYDIYPHVADKYGKSWRGYKGLKRALDAIGASAFRGGTDDFRNAYNHRFSPRFVVGMTQLVTRIVNEKTGQVRYGFGGREPLDLAKIVTLLEREQMLFYVAFASFQELVREHEAAIREQAQC